MRFNVPIRPMLKFQVALLPLSIGLTISAPAAYATIADPDEVIVTARRMKEEAQTVPISMAVFNQEMLSERNVTNGADLANFTPSLSVNTRFGSDQASFAIRGFTQELRTAASVAVYFADVVAPRGGGSITAGDGAGPGAFFDLQNVQVLKGPQGTLFGRNTTGGAIQLVPQEPTTKLEGYLELSDGNYDMHRYQGVLNVPMTDNVRARLGFDRQTRDGYINNISGIGPDTFSNIDYATGRVSVMWDITDMLRNYTIYTSTYSRNNGSVQGIFQCAGGGLGGALCQSSYDVWQSGGGDFYDVVSDTPEPTSTLRQWQLINTTTWDASDDLTVKNIVSFAHLKQTTRGSIFGSNINGGGQHFWFFPAGTWHGIPSNAQNTFVEELQFQGKGFDDKLIWQAGLYYENSRPDGISGALSPALADCTVVGNNVQDWSCQISPGSTTGGLVSSLGTIEYKNMAAYTQSTYNISDEYRVTLGIRYTVDESIGESKQQAFVFAPDSANLSRGKNFVPDPTWLPAGQVSGFNCTAAGGDPNDYCAYKMRQRSEAPTWSLGFDYLPSPDAMIYAKYSRGYRQGSVSIFAPDGLQEFDPEKVDAYEVGAKTTFRGAISGTFNVSLFYNDLKNQQLQGNYVPCGLTKPCAPGESSNGLSPTTAILNAGSSTLQGVEMETVLRLTQSLMFTASYTFLSTKLNSIEPYPSSPGYVGGANNVAGDRLTFSPRHSITTGLSYTLPVPASWGEISLGGSYSFTSDQDSCSTKSTDPNTPANPYCRLPSRRLVGLNASWKAIAGSPFDASLFANNLLDEEVTAYVPGLYGQVNAEYRSVGEPRMYGAKLKYSF